MNGKGKLHFESMRSYLPELWWQLEPVPHIIKAIAQVRGVYSHKDGLVTHLLSSLHQLPTDLTVFVDVQLHPAECFRASLCHFFY